MVEEGFPKAEEPKAAPGKGLAVAALVCAIPGLCFFPLGITALILGIIALVKKTGGRSLALAGVVMGGLSLVLIPFIAIIAAIAMPAFLGARKNAYEAAAVAGLRNYASAQAVYMMNNNTYADQLAKLAKDQTVDAGLAAAYGANGTPRLGYVFRECKTIGGKPIDWPRDFALSAIPAAPGTPVRRSFIIRSDGTVYGMDRPSGGGFVDDFPEDPTAAGWTVAR